MGKLRLSHLRAGIAVFHLQASGGFCPLVQFLNFSNVNQSGKTATTYGANWLC
jgi:hypothetical protein